MKDIELIIYSGRSRRQVIWDEWHITWQRFARRLKISTETKETHAEFMEWKKIRKDTNRTSEERAEAERKETAAKDTGAFVGGILNAGKRKNSEVCKRTLITLDADNATEEMLEKVRDFGAAAVIYSTHSKGPENLKLRLVFPLSRPIDPDEFEAISRKMCEMFGMDCFDRVSFVPAQMMYFPSHSKDVTPFYEFLNCEIMEPEKVLNLYKDWHDKDEWPQKDNEIISKTQQKTAPGKVRGMFIGKIEDPLKKSGIVGDFCRAYSIPEAIEKYLSDVYIPTEDPARYTYKNGSSVGGLILYKSESSEDYVLAYSMHDTDPANDGHCKNAFDLVRIHLFGTGS